MNNFDPKEGLLHHRCLSLLQPWAQLVCLGKKTQETRSWRTKYRGILYIHASKNPKFAKQFQYEWPFAEYVDIDDGKMQFGYIIGQVFLRKIEESETALREMQKFETEDMAEEFKFGDYSPGRWVWYLRDPVLFEEPIPARGGLLLWNYKTLNP